MQEGILIMEVDIVQEICYRCNISFWITTSHHKQLIKSKEGFYCPNGHAQHYLGETDAKKLQRIERYLEDAKYYRDRAMRSNAALRGVITKMKRKKS